MSVTGDFDLQSIIHRLKNDKWKADLRADGSILLEPLKGLPDEILDIIINHASDSKETIHQCTFVSKQFNRVANPILWKSLVFNNSTVSKIQTSMSRLSMRCLHDLCYFVKTLDLSEQPDGSTVEAKTVLSYMPSLERFAVNGNFFKMPPNVVALLPPRYRFLKSLCLRSVHVSEATFVALGNHEHITDFEWWLSPRQTPTYLTHLIPRPLQRLSIIFNQIPLSPAMVTTILQFDNLTWLEVWTQGNLPNTLLSTTALPHLTTLRLAQCDDLSDTDLANFFKTHLAIKKLTLLSTRHLGDQTLDAMGLLQLAYINITITSNQEATMEDVERLELACPLTTINIDDDVGTTSHSHKHHQTCISGPLF